MRASVAARIAAAVVATTMTLSVFGLAGCSQQGSDSDAERIAELEREVEQLKNQQSSDGGAGANGGVDANGGSAAGADANTSAGTAGGSGQTAQNAASITDATTLDFSNRADELIAEADAATPPSDRAELIALYFDYDARFDALEDEIDRYGDQKEMEYRNNVMSWEDYRTIDAQLDAIEARLDYAKDDLEWRFGVDD